MSKYKQLGKQRAYVLRTFLMKMFTELLKFFCPNRAYNVELFNNIIPK